MDLFDYMRENQMEKEAPLASRLRPRTLDEVVGQQHIIGKDKLLYRAIKADKLGSLIFYGPPGTGKTTLAKVIANTTSAQFRQMNATVAGKKDMEEVVQGSLSNIAGGIVLLVTHPYRVGDEIELDGNKGIVEDIKLFYTYIRKSDNTLVVIPNSTAANDEIINYTTKPTRRVELIFSVAYENDFETAKAIILECVNGLDYALEDPEPFVGVEAHAASSVDIAVKFWVPTEKYYDAKYAMREAVKLAFDANGIEIPYPQLQIHTAADKESKVETKKK